jgi:hypothetical protein
MTTKKGRKTLEENSAYEQYDIDGDGIVSDSELATIKAIHEAETQEEKADAQRRMAWISLGAMIVFTILVFLPIFPDSRIKALADLFGLFYIGMAGVVGAYMGMTAYMSAKK